MWTANGSVVPGKDWLMGQATQSVLTAQATQYNHAPTPKPSVIVPDVNVAAKVFDRPDNADYKKQLDERHVAMYLADGSFRKVPKFIPSPKNA
jgi:hypothetical protein